MTIRMWRIRNRPFCLAFRAMGKDLESITLRVMKTYVVHCINSSLPDLVLNLET